MEQFTLPAIGRTGGDRKILDQDLQYDYPKVDGKRLDLRPGSKLSNELIEFVTKKADFSFAKMSPRHEVFYQLDRLLTTYVPLKRWEQAKRTRAPRRPVAVVVPQAYANLDTLMTYFQEVFLGQRPTWAYEGIGPEDVVGAKFIELKTQMDVDRATLSVPLTGWMRDGLVYGQGALLPGWKVERGPRRYTRVEAVMDAINSVFGRRVRGTLDILYEGNTATLVDPYRVLPDPGVPATNPQDGRYWSWSSIEDVLGLRAEEMNGDNLFNVAYIEKAGGNLCTRWTADRSGRIGIEGSSMYESWAKENSTVINMYAKLVPSQLGLGKSDLVENWFMRVADGQVIIDLRPVGLEHGRFPVCIGVPDFDGHSFANLSRIELIFGMALTSNFMMNSFIENTVRSLMNLFLVDPSRIVIDDILNPSPAGLIRTTEEYYGSDVRTAFQQLAVNNVTQENIMNLRVLGELMDQGSGAIDVVKGMFRSGRGDRSATEAENAIQSAMSRLKRLAQNFSNTGMTALGTIFAHHAIQFMTKPMFVREMGDWPKALQDEFKRRQKTTGARGLYFDRDHLDVLFDVRAKDGSQPINPNYKVNTALQIMQTMSGFGDHPQFRQFDLLGWVMKIARLMGTYDLGEYLEAGGADVQMMDNEEVLREHEAGNLLTGDEAMAQLGAGMQPTM